MITGGNRCGEIGNSFDTWVLLIVADNLLYDHDVCNVYLCRKGQILIKVPVIDDSYLDQFHLVISDNIIMRQCCKFHYRNTGTLDQIRDNIRSRTFGNMKTTPKAIGKTVTNQDAACYGCPL